MTRGNGYYNRFLVRSGQSLRRLRYRNHRSCRSPLDGFTMGSRYSHGVTLGGGSLSRENSAKFSEKGSSVLPNSQERMRRWQSWGFRSWCQQRPCPGPILVADCTISPTIHNRYTFQPVAFHAVSPPVYRRLFPSAPPGLSKSKLQSRPAALHCGLPTETGPTGRKTARMGMAGRV